MARYGGPPPEGAVLDWPSTSWSFDVSVAVSTVVGPPGSVALPARAASEVSVTVLEVSVVDVVVAGTVVVVDDVEVVDGVVVLDDEVVEDVVVLDDEVVDSIVVDDAFGSVVDDDPLVVVVSSDVVVVSIVVEVVDDVVVVDGWLRNW